MPSHRAARDRGNGGALPLTAVFSLTAVRSGLAGCGRWLTGRVGLLAVLAAGAVLAPVAALIALLPGPGHPARAVGATEARRCAGRSAGTSCRASARPRLRPDQTAGRRSPAASRSQSEHRAGQPASPPASPTAAPSTPAPVPTPAPADAAAAASVLAMINQARARAGLPPYTVISGLQVSSARHTRAMADGCGLSHQCPGEPPIGDRESAAGVPWTAAGENIGDGGGVADSTAPITRMALLLTRDMLDEKPPDDGHRLNLLSSVFTHVGITVYRDSRGVVWLTQDFSN